MRQSMALALEISKTGQIEHIYYNDVSTSIKSGRLFPTILYNSEFTAGLNFLNRLQQEKMLFDIPLGIDINGTSKSFYFSGVTKGDIFFLMGSNNQGIDASIYDEIAKVNNELANQLRESMKSNLQRPATLDEPQLEEFTKLNNELVNIQRELNKSNRKLAVLNEQKNQLIGIAAHDLRNPLGVISGYVQFIKGTSNNLNDGQLQMLDKVLDTANKMIVMLEELLDMSELDSGKVVLNLSETDLTKLIAENVELNQVIADRKNIKLNFKAPDEVVITIDAPKIEQVINNFISNAIKYSHADTQVFISIEVSNGEVLVKVRDEGQGIPKGELHKVFEPFKTTSVKSTGGEKSTGLGLAITKKVVEAHRGHIGVESEVNVGTEFYFTLPLYKTE